MESFEAYVLWVSKGTYVDKRKPEQGPKDQYNIIAVMADSNEMFTMNLRNTAMRCLSSLVTTAQTEKRGIYSIKVRFETKELTNDNGTWYIPVVRVVSMIEDSQKLIDLESLAIHLEKMGAEVIKKQQDKEDAPAVPSIYPPEAKKDPGSPPSPDQEELDIPNF